MTDLLSAVDELTLVVNTRERQEILEDGKVIGFQNVTVSLPPLLQQMDDAIRSSMGGNTSGASLAHEASPLDTDALFKLIKIESQIRDWCRNFRVTPSKRPVDDLRAWYVATLAKGLDDAAEDFYVNTLGGWAGTIRAKLDPWREKDLPSPCPLCGSKSWWQDGAEYYRPLVIRYHPDDPEMVKNARGFCRSCEAIWPVRALAYELEHPEISGSMG